MEILAAAIACVAVAVVVAAFVLSAAVRRLAAAVSSVQIHVESGPEVRSARPITAHNLPDPPRSIRWDDPGEDVERARLEIQKMAFNVPPLIPLGGDAVERTSDLDVEEISRGIPNGAADR